MPKGVIIGFGLCILAPGVLFQFLWGNIVLGLFKNSLIYTK